MGPRLRPADGAIAVLAVVTLTLVGYALRSPKTAPNAGAEDTITPGSASPTAEPSEASTPSPTATASPSVAVTPSPGATAGEFTVVAGNDGSILSVDISDDCTAGGVLARRSGDDGKTWGRVDIPVRSLRSIDARAGLGLASGYGDGCAPVLLRTTDLGASWQPVPDAPALSAVAVGDATRAWGLSASDVMVSADAGATWTKAATPCARTRTQVGPIGQLVAADGTNAWVLCSGEPVDGRQARLLLRTTDGGKTWDEMAGARTTAVDDGGRKDGLDGAGVVDELVFADAKAGVVLLRETECAAGGLLKSADSGSTWTAVPCVDSVASLISVRSGGTGLLAVGRTTAGELVLLRSTDAGATWTAPTPIG